MTQKIRASAACAFGLAALSVTSCGSDSNDSASECAPPVVRGSPAGSMGSATVSGNCTLPPGVPNGFDLQLLLNQVTSTLGVIPDGLVDFNPVCGPDFSYSITRVESGTYTLEFQARDPGSESFEPEYMGRATESFTIADGQMLTFDATFR